MKFIRLLPALISALVLAAHFFRAQNLFLTAASIGVVILVVFFRQPWARLVVRVSLLIGSIEWMRTMFVLVMQRKAFGAPWGRMAMILSTVALFTLVSSLIFTVKKAERCAIAEK